MRGFVLVGAVALCACLMPSSGSDGGLGGADASSSSCLGADAAACAASGCVGLKGWPSTGEPSVIDGGGEYAGCAAPSDLGGGHTFTCATSPTDGGCWLFKDTCVPEGWTTVSCAGDPSLFCPSIQ